MTCNAAGAISRHRLSACGKCPDARPSLTKRSRETTLPSALAETPRALCGAEAGRGVRVAAQGGWQPAPTHGSQCEALLPSASVRREDNAPRLMLRGAAPATLSCKSSRACCRPAASPVFCGSGVGQRGWLTLRNSARQVQQHALAGAAAHWPRRARGTGLRAWRRMPAPWRPATGRWRWARRPAQCPGAVRVEAGGGAAAGPCLTGRLAWHNVRGSQITQLQREEQGGTSPRSGGFAGPCQSECGAAGVLRKLGQPTTPPPCFSCAPCGTW